MTTWQDPPTSATGGRRGKYVTAKVKEELRANPGRWLLLDQHTRRAAVAVRNWVTRNPGFDSTSRSDGEHFDVYVRYVGEQ